MAKKVPALAPLDVPRLVCTECGSILRMQVKVQNNGKLVDVRAYCDHCEYCFKMSTPHGVGEIVGGGYERPRMDGVLAKEVIEIVGLSKPAAPAPQKSNADDPRIGAPGGDKA